MNQLTETDIKPIHSPDEAINLLVGEQFIEWLSTFVDHEVKHWPALQTLRTIKVALPKLQRFMLQCFLAATAFWGGREGDPGFLSFAIGNLSEVSDPLALSALAVIEKKREEEFTSSSENMQYIRSEELYLKLLHSLGVLEEEIKRSKPKEVTRHYIAELSDIYSNSEWQEAMGAFAACQIAQVKEYALIVQMIKNNSTVSDAELSEFIAHFGSEVKYKVGASQVLEKIVFGNESKRLVFNGVQRQLEVRKDFYAGLLKYLGG